jgi:hypothetical protein
VNNRIDFSEKTRTILAGRAGYQCSHPDCDMITIGPGDTYEQTSSVGEAAHIYSASTNGPRGQNGLTEEDLKSVNNGMWLCKTHARLIDTNSGQGFTASQLISWKQLHEEAIKRRQGRIHRNVGWISKIRIISSPIFVDDSIINLGKVTLLESSKNAAGKTAICEWLAVVGSDYSPQRWIPSLGKEIKFRIDVLLPEPHTINVAIDGMNYGIDIDGVDSPFCAIPFKSFFFGREVFKVEGKERLKESEYLCKALNVDIYTLKKLFNKIGFSEYSKIRKIALSDFDEDNDIECTLKHRNFSVSFNALSGGESSSLIFELLIAKMQSYAEFTPLIFFIEASETSFDKSAITHYLDFLGSSEISFQTVVTSISSSPSKPIIGTAHFFLEGAKENVEVIQV